MLTAYECVCGHVHRAYIPVPVCAAVIIRLGLGVRACVRVRDGVCAMPMGIISGVSLALYTRTLAHAVDSRY